MSTNSQQGTELPPIIAIFSTFILTLLGTLILVIIIRYAQSPTCELHPTAGINSFPQSRQEAATGVENVGLNTPHQVQVVFSSGNPFELSVGMERVAVTRVANDGQQWYIATAFIEATTSWRVTPQVSETSAAPVFYTFEKYWACSS